ncbi:hypothetical protein DSL72_006625 [Monilinia vaccinii-corymbosi]|uniref:Rhodopsin domain-containing protein n=1 Tax=Monilinia vaccinii-corymbosi TaxID=61207 RepID=A0A8A3PMP6_9HELO|nr:hypothetical protein DSL72_006625 [Monilinia vaccinii-corymbosi]
MFSSSALEALKDLPALEPPPGVTPNLLHPENKSYILITICSLLLSLMILCFSARVYVRFTTKTCVWADGVVLGPVGKHQWDVTIGDVTSNNFIIAVAFLSNVLFSPTLLLAKVTLFFLYLELFQPFKWMRICVYIGVATTTIFYLATGILMIVWSSPHRGETWQTHLFTYQQQKAQIYASSFSAVGLAIDLYLLVLPLKAVCDLYLPLKRKLAAGVVFLTGIFACIASTLSVYYRFINKQTHTKDTTWALQNVIICSLAEMFIGVIVSCMPATWKCMRQNMPRFLGSNHLWKKKPHSPDASSSSRNSPAQSGPERVDSLHQKEANKSNTKITKVSSSSSSPVRECSQRSNPPQVPLELSPLWSVATYIRSDRKRTQVRDDQIHLQQEIWQTEI